MIPSEENQSGTSRARASSEFSSPLPIENMNDHSRWFYFLDVSIFSETNYFSQGFFFDTK